MDFVPPIQIKTNESHKPNFKIELYSEDRLNQNDSSSECKFIVNPSIETARGESIKIKVDQCSIPHSFYLINENNNKLYVEEDLLGETEITLTNGNYSVYDLIDELENQFNNNLTKTYSWSYNKISNTLKCTQSEADLAYQIEFKSNSPYKVMGFNKEVYSSDASFEISSIKTCDLLGLDSIYITANFTSVNSYSSRSNGRSSVLARVPITVDAFYVLEYNTRDSDFSVLLPPNQSINEIILRLEDSEGNLIDLNKMEWSISLLVSYHHQRIKI